MLTIVSPDQDEDNQDDDDSYWDNMRDDLREWYREEADDGSTDGTVGTLQTEESSITTLRRIGLFEDIELGWIPVRRKRRRTLVGENIDPDERASEIYLRKP